MGDIRDLPILYEDDNITLYTKHQDEIGIQYFIQCKSLKDQYGNKKVWEKESKSDLVQIILNNPVKIKFIKAMNPEACIEYFNEEFQIDKIIETSNIVAVNSLLYGGFIIIV